LVHNLKLGLHLARRYARRIELDDAFQYAFFGLMQAIRKFDWRLGNQFSTYATWWIRQSLSREIADAESTIRLPVYVVDRVNSYKRDLRELEADIFTTASEVTVKDRSGNLLRTEPSLPQLSVFVEMDETFKFALDTVMEPLEFWDTFHQARWLLARYETPDDSLSFTEFSAISKDLLERLTRFVLSEQQVEILKMRNGYANGEPMTLDDIGKIYDLTRERIRQIESKALKRVFTFLDGVDLRNYWEVIERASINFQESEAKSPSALAAQKRIEKQEKEAEKELLQSERKKILYEQNKGRDLTHFESANIGRTKLAGESQVLQLVWALNKTQGLGIPERTLEVARRRISNPELSLKDLAATFNDPLISKDVVAGTIRRLIARATNASGENPPMTNL
jgi:RNA polymerase primary sigma factor